MPNQFFSPEGDIENYFVSEYWLIDQYVGDQLWTWGRGSYGRLGNNQTTNRLTPVTTFAGGTNWKQVSGGYFHTAAVKTNGTLWTWGRNEAFGSITGMLGTNNTINRSTPVTTFAGGNNWKQVQAGAYHTVALKTDGTLWTWGRGSYGGLGNNQTTDRLTPVTTFSGGNNWKQASAGFQYTAAIKTDGTLWIWGRGGAGNLGNALTTDRLTPVTTFAGGNNWKQVSSGGQHAIAIKTDGTLWTWGSGNALGNAQLTNRSTPVTTFAGGNNWKQVSAGDNVTAAIKTDGTLWTWGSGDSGRLGNNQTTSRSTPVTTFAGGNNWKQINPQPATIAVKTDGTLWTWGRGSYGQLGNNQTTNRLTPVTTFAGGTNWKQVSGGSHTAAVQAGINAEYPLS
jgi:alpha-tubulin suppressor-like RCC1 family protein